MPNIWGLEEDCPVCGEPFASMFVEAGMAQFNHDDEVCKYIVPRMRCPQCGGFLIVESQDPVEERCSECGYEREEGGVLMERS